jgi:hypothetical protein
MQLHSHAWGTPLIIIIWSIQKFAILLSTRISIAALPAAIQRLELGQSSYCAMFFYPPD